jgi:hypothetical protein
MVDCRPRDKTHEDDSFLIRKASCQAIQQKVEDYGVSFIKDIDVRAAWTISSIVVYSS